MPEQKPLFNKCCFCLPILPSIQLWNFLRLISSLSGAFTLIFNVLPRNTMPAPVIAIIVLLLADSAIVISHIVGGCKKHVNLLKFSVYYNILWCLIILGVVGFQTYETFFCRYCRGLDSMSVWRFVKFFLPGFTSVCLQIYVILLTRSEIVIIKNQAVKDQLWKNAYERAQAAGANAVAAKPQEPVTEEA